MVKSGIEDLLKHSQDKRRNSAPIKIYRGGAWVDAMTKDVRAGDLVRHDGDAMVACDMLYIASSAPDRTVHYSEVQLNGESAVKTMPQHPVFKGQDIPSFLEAHAFSVDLPPPDRDLTRFDARLRGPGDTTHPIAAHNVLLRAMKIHCTDWVIGVALTTGHDTKVMQNSRHPPAKSTTFETRINWMIAGVFVFKMIVITSCSAASAVGERDGSFPYLLQVTSSGGNSFLVCWLQYFVLYSYLIPISLIVTVEIIRLFHMFAILWDAQLTDMEFGRAAPHNSNVMTQLGVVTHVLSDKTGTLTENIMELVAFADSGGARAAADGGASLDFLLALAICNSVIVYRPPDGDAQYNAESPDESAFVAFAAASGVQLVDRGHDSITLRVNGEIRRIEVVAVIPFTSERKRMTVVIADGEALCVYTKGADIALLPRAVEARFEADINRFALAGLRTLLFGLRRIEGNEANEWRALWHEAASTIHGRTAAIAEAAIVVEDHLELIGASAVEDRLQPQVQESVQWLRDAGIRVWVLTGDKLETAVEIGRTSAVIAQHSEMLVVSQETDEGVHEQFSKYLAQWEQGEHFADPVLILTAHATERVLGPELNPFLAIAERCQSVIFCRVSPFQKASIVALLKRQKNARTLAIGDGANDVGMLQEADVGVGVKGREGAQAASASDFAVPRFRHLIPLLAIHGHWICHRLTHVSMFMLYKNFVMIAVYLWSSFETMSSPADFYDEFLLSFFNLLFTMLPPFAYGLWERDIVKRSLLEFPQLYWQKWDPMNFPWALGFFGLALYQSIAVYYIVRCTIPDGALQLNGNLSYICVVCIVAIQFMLWSYDWNILIVITCALTIGLLFAILVAYAYGMTPSLIGMVHRGIGEWRGWLIIAAVLSAALLPYVAFRVIVDIGWPDLNRLVRERDGERKAAERHEAPDFWEIVEDEGELEMDVDG
jgi:magnesium-transporting ATPase (P-type)